MTASRKNRSKPGCSRATIASAIGEGHSTRRCAARARPCPRDRRVVSGSRACGRFAPQLRPNAKRHQGTHRQGPALDRAQGERRRHLALLGDWQGRCRTDGSRAMGSQGHRPSRRRYPHRLPRRVRVLVEKPAVHASVRDERDEPTNSAAACCKIALGAPHGAPRRPRRPGH